MRVESFQRLAVGEFGVREAEGAHGHVLVLEQLGVDFGFGHSGGVETHSEDNLGGALDVEDALAGGRLYDRGHVLAFGSEWQLLKAPGAVAQPAVVDAALTQP